MSPVSEEEIARAQMMCATLWPDVFPQSEETKRLIAFATALEELSCHYGFWIRAPFPNIWPVLAESQDDEDGYTLRPMSDGRSFMIDRRLKR